MIVSGIAIEAADGLHDDGWCWAETRLTLKALSAIQAVRVGVWMKPESDGPAKALVTGRCSLSDSKVQFVDLGMPTEIELPAQAEEGEEFSVSILCHHRPTLAPGEQRKVVFMLMSVVGL